MNARRPVRASLRSADFLFTLKFLKYVDSDYLIQTETFSEFFSNFSLLPSQKLSHFFSRLCSSKLILCITRIESTLNLTIVISLIVVMTVFSLF